MPKLILAVLLVVFVGSLPLTFANAQSSPSVRFTSTASCSPIGIGIGYSAIAVPIVSNLQGTINAVLFGVLHNSAGQTLQISTSSLSLSPGENQTAYLLVTLPHGNYSVDLFAWTFSGDSISSKQTVELSC